MTANSSAINIFLGNLKIHWQGLKYQVNQYLGNSTIYLDLIAPESGGFCIQNIRSIKQRKIGYSPFFELLFLCPNEPEFQRQFIVRHTRSRYSDPESGDILMTLKISSGKYEEIWQDGSYFKFVYMKNSRTNHYEIIGAAISNWNEIIELPEMYKPKQTKLLDDIYCQVVFSDKEPDKYLCTKNVIELVPFPETFSNLHKIQEINNYKQQLSELLNSQFGKKISNIIQEYL